MTPMSESKFTGTRDAHFFAPIGSISQGSVAALKKIFLAFSGNATIFSLLKKEDGIMTTRKIFFLLLGMLFFGNQMVLADQESWDCEISTKVIGGGGSADPIVVESVEEHLSGLGKMVVTGENRSFQNESNHSALLKLNSFTDSAEVARIYVVRSYGKAEFSGVYGSLLIHGNLKCKQQ